MNSTDAPQYSTDAAVATNVIELHKIISFLFQPKAIPIKCNAAVPLETAKAYLHLNFFLNSSSNFFT